MAKEKCNKLGSSPSVIRSLFEYGKLRKQQLGEDKVFDFSIGNPSVPSPKGVTDTLVKLLTEVEPEKLHGYTSAQGDEKARMAIVEHLNQTYHTSLSKDLVYLTCGAAASLTIAINGLTEEGDEVIVVAPYFPEYKVYCEGAKANLVCVNSNKNTFYPDFDDLKAKISPKTKMVIINSPNNPTGVVYPEEVIKTLAKVLEDKQKEYFHDIYLVSDEPYRELIFNGTVYPFVTNYYHNSIVCYSYSKSLSLPGERIGYVLVNPQANEAKTLFACLCGAGRMLGFVCAPTIFQHLIPHISSQTADFTVYKKNLEILHHELKSIGYEVINPGGAFYLFVKALEDDAYKFMEVAKTYELLLVPSDSFGVKGYVRISYCVDTSTIINSIDAFKKLYKHYH